MSFYYTCMCTNKISRRTGTFYYRHDFAKRPHFDEKLTFYRAIPNCHDPEQTSFLKHCLNMEKEW